MVESLSVTARPVANGNTKLKQMVRRVGVTTRRMQIISVPLTACWLASRAPSLSWICWAMNRRLRRLYTVFKADLCRHKLVRMKETRRKESSVRQTGSTRMALPREMRKYRMGFGRGILMTSAKVAVYFLTKSNMEDQTQQR